MASFEETNLALLVSYGHYVTQGKDILEMLFLRTFQPIFLA